MKLSRLTQTSKFEIKAPRWKSRVVGLAVHRVSEHNEIEILAANKHGERYYPDTYYISGDAVRGMEVQDLFGVRLYLVPIHKLDVLIRTDP